MSDDMWHARGGLRLVQVPANSNGAVHTDIAKSEGILLEIVGNFLCPTETTVYAQNKVN